MDEKIRSDNSAARPGSGTQTVAEVRTDDPHFVHEPGDDAAQDRASVSRWRRPLFYGLVLLLVGLGLWRALSLNGEVGRRPRQDVQQVGAAKVITGDIKQTLSGLGTVTPLATITVQTQINGQLLNVGFKEGQIVQKGDFLAQIDPRPYQASLDQAQGALAHDTGLLEQAQSDLTRYETLAHQNSIALQQVTDQEFLVQQDKGLVLEDQATIETAKLNLTYCHIVAPVTGRVGLRLVDPGNYVQTTASTGLVVLTQLQPISIVFVIAEDDIQDVWRQVRAGKTLTVTAYNRSDAKLIATGALESVDNEIDTTTGTVKLRATFSNADEMLFPNQFVNARLLVDTLTGVTVAPVAAIQHGAPGAFVFRIRPDGVASVQPITTGATDGDSVQIVSGLTAGDVVVVDGADRLRDGTKVRITADPSESASSLNQGPGAPPGKQPTNAGKIPRAFRIEPDAQPNSNPAGKSPQNTGN
jgi:membrane fusion protein, multidrug efflux system